MEFSKISEDVYRNFWDKHPQKTFLSAPEIGNLRGGRKNFFLGVKKNKKLIAAAMIRGTKTRLGKYDFYAPRGILVDYDDKKVLKFFVEKVTKFLKEQGGYILRIEPMVILKERDINGNEVPNGENHENVIKNLEELGFKKVKYKEGKSQITWQFVLDVKGKTEDELLKDMKSGRKRSLKKAETLGMTVRTADYNELGEFYRVLQATAKRKGFEARNLEYFQKMYKAFAPRNEIEFVFTEINPEKSIKKLQKMRQEIKKKEIKNNKERLDQENTLKSIDIRIEKIKKAFPKKENRDILLSVGMFMKIKPEMLYFAGGNLDEYMDLGGQYILQWHMIKKALSEGYARYNFYGIPENINQHPENYGVYEFKQGFGGYVEQMIGEFELPLSSYYTIGKILKKLCLIR